MFNNSLNCCFFFLIAYLSVNCNELIDMTGFIGIDLVTGYLSVDWTG